MPSPGPNLFNKKSSKVTPGFALGVVLNSEPVPGQVGIEIEVEGKHLPNQDLMPKHWRATHDGSLRGQECLEYVLARPLPFDDIPEALNALWHVFKEKKSVFDDSNRTSVHVHLNFQKFHLTRMASFCAMYFTLEEVLTQWCGDHRVGNLFCLRAKDAPAIVSRIKKFIQADGDYQFGDFMKYSGLNPYALRKYGSMEVRTLRGCSEPDVILSWVAILRRIYELSADFTDPRKVCELFSGRGPTGFFEEILGPMAMIVRSGVPFNNEEIEDSLYRGIRLAQDICYCRDWDLYKPVDVKDDPFGRSIKAKKTALAHAAAMIDANTQAQPAPAVGLTLQQYLQQPPAPPQFPTLPPIEPNQFEPDQWVVQNVEEGPEEPDF